jgi:hypothetical protein
MPKTKVCYTVLDIHTAIHTHRLPRDTVTLLFALHGTGSVNPIPKDTFPLLQTTAKRAFVCAPKHHKLTTHFATVAQLVSQMDLLTRLRPYDFDELVPQNSW